MSRLYSGLQAERHNAAIFAVALLAMVILMMGGKPL